MWDLGARRVQVIPVFGSLLLAFVVPGITTQLREGIPRRGSFSLWENRNGGLEG